MSQDQNQEEDILLKLTMPGKSQRIDPKDAPKLPEQTNLSQQPSPISQPSQQPAALAHSSMQQPEPQKEINTIVPPANTPPVSEEAQEDILRKLTMKSKEYELAAPDTPREKEIRPPPGMVYQTPAEIKSNKPYVSTEHEIERVKNLARNIYGTDLVQKRTQKK